VSARVLETRGALPRTKLLLACGLVLLLALVAPRVGASTVGLARGVLGACALAGAAWWWARGRARGPAFQLTEPLQVLSRRGLSPRCSVALVEAEGRRFLIAYGDAFAQVQPMPRARHRPASRAAKRTCTALPGVLQ
jgi:flagellar protein FliO/FliZ